MAEGRQKIKIDKRITREEELFVPRFSVALSLTHIKQLSLSLSSTQFSLLNMKGYFSGGRGGIVGRAMSQFGPQKTRSSAA